MKKTLTVNLGGTVFNIDDDAYRLLDNYLSNLKMHFRKEAGADEIVDDIERRISELFAEKLSAGSQVITIADVEEVIARMGKPEDIPPSPPRQWSLSNHHNPGNPHKHWVFGVPLCLRVHERYTKYIPCPMHKGHSACP